MDATTLLRPHLLDGRAIALGGGGGDPLSQPLTALGAAVSQLPATPDEEAMAGAVDPLTDVLVHDLRPAFGIGGGGDASLRGTLDLAWITVRAVANAAFIPDARGGKVTLIAPRAGGSESADVAAAGVRAAAENLARTLSIEWARHGITTVAITPGEGTAEEEIEALVAFLASPAGDYWSGCRLSLGELPLTA